MRALVPALLAVTVVACSHVPPLTTPARFLELEEEEASDYRYRASSADGVVIAVRELEIDPARGGDLQFWVDATQSQIRGRRGYALLEQAEVETSAGKGHQMRFGRDERGRTYRYWLTVVLTEHALYVIEAGGPSDKFEAHQPAVEAAIKSLKP